MGEDADHVLQELVQHLADPIRVRVRVRVRVVQHLADQLAVALGALVGHEGVPVLLAHLAVGVGPETLQDALVHTVG